MTEPLERPANEPAAPPRTPRAPRAFSWRHPVLIIMMIAIALLAWQWVDTRNELRRTQNEFTRRLADGDTAAKEARAIARQNQETLQTLQSKTAVLEAEQAQAQGQQAALDSLYQEFSRARDERTLAQATQAVDIASQQLQLASNVPAALAALQAADNSLASLDRPQLISVRKLLARDMDRLRALPLADVDSMSVTLDAMLGRIDNLPLGFEHTPAKAASATPRSNVVRNTRRTAGTAQASAPVAASAPIDTSDRSPNWVGGLFSDLWDEFRELVRIERLDRPEPALLSPQQAVYLRENLRLRLLSARLALLQRDGKVFNEDITQARRWLERYFDIDARPVAAMIAELKQIEGARLSVDLPSLNETEAALRSVKLGSH
ncbi:uroporphyrinogen-III C-methyltransferase [Uliginosibacterium sp. sgz301328]|uniref:uroporphyrinogen-III C-methyltransferase n=1 Tax=Uliginosibacterium sp. sgz301328 TaxID=3243764 RepID=UPI00359E9A19